VIKVKMYIYESIRKLNIRKEWDIKSLIL